MLRDRTPVAEGLEARRTRGAPEPFHERKGRPRKCSVRFRPDCPGRSRDRRPGETGVRRDYVAHVRDGLSAARRAAVWNYDTALCLRPVRRLRGVAAPGFLSRRARGPFDLRCLRPARYSAGDCPPRVFRRAGARALPFEKPQQKGVHDETGCQRFHGGEVARGVP